MTYSGKYIPENPQKYRGNVDNIIYRSSWEKKFLKYLDHNKSILEYSSEEIVVPYISPLDNKIHRYFVDFWIKVKDKEGVIKEYLIEIKPYKETIKPKKKKLTPNFIKEVYTYAKNQSKWKAASEYCKQKNWQFLILTEKDLFKEV